MADDGAGDVEGDRLPAPSTLGATHEVATSPSSLAAEADSAASVAAHLDWSARQSRILTADGLALGYFSAERGFPFRPDELPHCHLERGDSREVFRSWARRLKEEDERSGPAARRHPIVGAWKRTLFASQMERSTDDDEEVYNVQTRTLFVDLRVPRCRPEGRWEDLGRRALVEGGGAEDDECRRVLSSFSDLDLRRFARQHIFAGYSFVEIPGMTGEVGEGGGAGDNGPTLPSCTRHHCIDWNYVPGHPRPRPNKWWIDGSEGQEDSPPYRAWMEQSHAPDDSGRPYYRERWERLSGDCDSMGFRLAMRRMGGSVDAAVVAVGDHFNYAVGRRFKSDDEGRSIRGRYPRCKSLVELVDAAVESGDRDAAMSYLTTDGGHGTISSEWRVDLSLRPWNRGRTLFEILLPSGVASGDGHSGQAFPASVRASQRMPNGGGKRDDPYVWTVVLGEDDAWEVLECSVGPLELERRLHARGLDGLSGVANSRL
ncbi:hypothetical protein ACHAWF_012273 [Thalassiosira exigua]